MSVIPFHLMEHSINALIVNRYRVKALRYRHKSETKKQIHIKHTLNLEPFYFSYSKSAITCTDVRIFSHLIK